MTSGVYRILCLPTGKAYVGSSNRAEGRWIDHRRELRRGTHYCSHLQRSWDKYGEAHFLWELVEECGADRVGREQHWIDQSPDGMLLNGSRVAAYPEATPSVLKGRSERAIQQHAQGRLGRATWGPESHVLALINQKEAGKKRRGQPQPPEAVAKMRRTKVEKEWANPARRARQAEICRELMARPGHKEMMRQKQAEYWTPERRAAQAERAWLQRLAGGGRFLSAMPPEVAL